MTTEIQSKPPFPPFTLETAIQKIRMAEDGWNSRDPQRVSLVYTQIRNGATVQSFQKVVSRLWNF